MSDASPDPRPNVLYIMADDHASHAIGAYGSRINTTDFIDRLADEGMRFENCFCTNALCAPSRAAILTGTYNHVNGVRTLSENLDAAQVSFPPLLQAAGYQTAIYGKWHLGHGPAHDPHGFDDWKVLDGQGLYFDPDFFGPAGAEKIPGYVTDVITDLGIEWLEARDPDRPFCLLLHHKAPHRHFEPDEAHMHLFEDEDIPEPSTFRDDYATRADAARAARMRVDRDLRPRDLKADVPEGLDDDEVRSWKYQRYIKDYLRCVASIDDNVGRVLDYLDEHGLTENTIVVYTSDQGFFLGDHGWYDKRFMYEQSLRMPLLVRYPQRVAPGSSRPEMVSNVDFAPTLLELAGLPIPERMQGASLVPLLAGDSPQEWRKSLYYRYWEHGDPAHGVWAHYGVRTERYKLIYYYADGLGLDGTSPLTHAPEWELFDLETDPDELLNRYDDPEYRVIQEDMHRELVRLMQELGDEAYEGASA
ncbi:sulfatase family protein [Agromyces marinus]|uniref:Sulfatase n=1 Tax=Agromyces marinus TaxID=1389020 RepID=A0ABM8H4V8_9MICO|nr:sulfatase [Agromyces marinus]UIP59225.1 N-acetylglucosamine-6-O-sulfatase [Agromyces marinus]BDZ55769.1 sulfatase [Agromyces marinus]